ncbi:hypothetical protein A0H81_01778 [Grifola frondosa]|uniref:Myb/SANT-like domain-containing protein n=1 Tax=Grifola frondosa TaxID=5627 RepID=A0A1C7MMW7_GRIFR|nr:hypothetical protein A0H81_01778 [Grifola frondosa]
MAGKPTTEKAQWNDMEVVALIDYLISHKAKSGDDANFKNTTFNAVAIKIKFLQTGGPEKTGKMCIYWDNAHGANIKDDVSAFVWEAYMNVKSHAYMSARGAFAFSPSLSTPPSLATPPSATPSSTMPTTPVPGADNVATPFSTLFSSMPYPSTPDSAPFTLPPTPLDPNSGLQPVGVTLAGFR